MERKTEEEECRDQKGGRKEVGAQMEPSREGSCRSGVISQSVWAATTKYYRLGKQFINNRNLLLTVQEAEIRVPAWLGSGQSLLWCCRPLIVSSHGGE